ncbi:hypothetical protein [Enterococcus innesii]|uniref:hypothetical protein n=1 Tax=Enterococcus innesii TaxID=2839759 RepID=UPI0034A3E8C9
MLKIFGKEYQLIRLASWLMLVMGIIILGLKGLLFWFLRFLLLTVPHWWALSSFVTATTIYL